MCKHISEVRMKYPNYKRVLYCRFCGINMSELNRAKRSKALKKQSYEEKKDFNKPVSFDTRTSLFK